MSTRALYSPPQAPGVWSPLIGREEDLAALEHTVKQQRLVTLWGPGGSGKTRLALQVAAQLHDCFAEGARVVPCDDLHDPDRLVGHVASSLGLRLRDEERPLDALREWLQERHLLVVLDNCEHLLAACTPLVAELLATCSSLHVLVTSRELLNLPTERAYPVHPLTLPPLDECSPSGSTGLAAPEVGTYSAIQLFVQRAQMSQPDFALTPQNAGLVVRICRLLDGLPLAIELAAARVRMLALKQLAERLEASSTILGAANRLAPARQQTLQATINWSYQLLTPPEQQLFRRLTLVAGSFDLSLVEALQARDADPSLDAVELLAHLIDKSLVTVLTLEGIARYRLLDTLRHYGREQLQQSGETEATYQLYGNWVRQLTDQAESQLLGSEQSLWLDRLETEIEHIRTVIRWSLQHGKGADVIHISVALVTFCNHRPHAREVIQWLQAALGGGEAIEPALEAKAFCALGALTIRLAPYDREQEYMAEAQRYIVQAQERYAQLDDQAGMASAWYQLGFSQLVQMNYHVAKMSLEAGLAIVPKEAPSLQAGLLHRLAAVHDMLGEHEQAIDLYTKSLTVYRQMGDTSGVALALANLGRLLCGQGDHEQAQPYLRESLQHFADLGTRDYYLFALANLYDVALALEDPTLTQHYLPVALSSTWADCDLRLLGMLFERLARMAVQQGHPLRAAKLFGIRAALTKEPADPLPDALAARLTRDQYMAAWRAGHTMGLDEAFAFACEQAKAGQGTVTEGGAVAVATSLINTSQNPSTSTPIAPLHIAALGGGTVSRGESPGDSSASVNWRYSKARELLFYLLDAPHRTKGQICLALWPEVAEEQAGTHMRMAFYQLRKTLDDAAWVPFITPTGYAFNRSLPYRYDVEQFQALIAQAEALRETQSVLDAGGEADKTILKLLAQACALYHGPYLADFPPSEWILQRQTELQRHYANALSWLGETYERTGDVRQALACYQRLTTCDPYDEQAHAAILRCYVDLGQSSQALRHYRELQHFLRDELGATPDPRITTFVKTLLAQLGAAS